MYVNSHIRKFCSLQVPEVCYCENSRLPSFRVRDVRLATRLSAYYEYWSSRWMRLSVRFRRTTHNIWLLPFMFSTNICKRIVWLDSVLVHILVLKGVNGHKCEELEISDDMINLYEISSITYVEVLLRIIAI